MGSGGFSGRAVVVCALAVGLAASGCTAAPAPAPPPENIVEDLLPDAINVDFFGRPAATTSTLAALAIRTGAPVIPLFALPLPGGRYRMIYEPPVEPPGEDSPDAVREFTQRCTDVLEMHVRRHPELWLWMHRRWRGTPSEAAPGMFPSAAEEIGDQPD